MATATRLENVRRLVHDLREVYRNPLQNVAALPLDDNLFVWHGTVRSADGSLGGAVLHFVMLFPDNYPAEGPECRLYTPVPHPNVKKTASKHPAFKSAAFRLALWDCIDGQNFWSCAYTVHSILVQLQAFLLHEDLLYDTSKTAPEEAAAKASAFECFTCGHKGCCPRPALPEYDDLPAPVVHPRLMLSTPFVPTRCREAARTIQLHQLTPEQLKAANKAASSAAPKAVIAPKPAHTPAAQPAPAAIAPAEDEWLEVRSRKTRKEPFPGPFGKGPALKKGPGVGKGATPAAFSKQPAKTPAAALATPLLAGGGHAAAPGASTSSAMAIAHLSLPSKPALASSSAFALLADLSDSSDDEQPAAKAGAAPKVAKDGSSTHFPGAVLSAAAKKNLARRQKRRAQNQQQATAAAAPSPALGASAAAVASGTTGAAPAAAAVHAVPAAATQDDEDGWEVAGGAKATAKAAAKAAAPAAVQEPVEDVVALMKAVAVADPAPGVHCQLIQRIKEECAAAAAPKGPSDAAEHDDQLPALSADSIAAMAQFGRLPRDAMLAILCQLSPKEGLAALATTCRGLAAAASDGDLWRALLRREFPGSELSASRMADWRHAYLLEASRVVGELQCYFTKASFQDEVLGCPVRFTVNPKTRLLDYIEADADLLSVAAFKSGAVTHNAAKDRIDTVLPLYLTAEHFQAALPHLNKVLSLLAPEKVGAGGRAPPPEAWLEVLPKVLNTCVVLLADRGMSSSQRSLASFCGLHRMMLALCEHYCLWNAAAARLDKFLAKAANRTKSEVPNLGVLLPLLSVSPRHKWHMVAGPILDETFDRNIMWICKHAPAMAQVLDAPMVNGEVHEELLKEAWQAVKVSARLIMFHVGFLRLVACPQGSSLEQVMDSYDTLYGRPGAGLSRRFQSYVQRVLAVDGWDGYFTAIGIPPPSPAFMTARLKTAWRNSLAKKYHTRGMDFSRVQASGVSKILLKGESYSAPPNIRNISLEEHWRWRATSGTKFLDASCLLFAKDGRAMEQVDYSHTMSFTTKESGAVTHSGDIIDHADNAGTHRIDVDLTKLGEHVESMVITMSSWAGAKLIEIEQPFIKVVDPATGMELCGYSLEEQPKEKRQQNSAVIMARIQRSARTGGWEVKAIGHLCHGYAGSYDPILHAIRNFCS